MLGKVGSYLFGRGRTTAHPQCNRLQLRACFALNSPVTVALLCPQSGTPKARDQPCQGARREGGGHPCRAAPEMLLPA